MSATDVGATTDALERWRKLAGELVDGNDGRAYVKAAHDAYLQMKDSLTPEEDKAIQDEGTRIWAWANGPGPAAKHVVDRAVENHPGIADQVNANRPLFEDYARLVNDYYHAAAGGDAMAQQLVQEGTVSSVESGLTLVNEALGAIQKTIAKKRDELPVSRKKISHVSYYSGKGPEMETLFPVPPAPQEIPNNFFARMGAAWSRGFVDNVALGSEKWKAMAALAYPATESELKRIGPGKFDVIPASPEAFMHDLGMAFAWLPAEIAGGPAGRVVGKAASRLGPILKRVVQGAAEGGTIGFLNPEAAPTDIAGRARTAAVVGGVGGVIRGLGGIPEARAARAAKEVPTEPPGGAASPEALAEAATAPPAGPDLPRVEPQGAVRTPPTEAQKAQAEGQMASEKPQTLKALNQPQTLKALNQEGRPKAPAGPPVGEVPTAHGTVMVGSVDPWSEYAATVRREIEAESNVARNPGETEAAWTARKVSIRAYLERRFGVSSKPPPPLEPPGPPQPPGKPLVDPETDLIARFNQELRVMEVVRGDQNAIYTAARSEQARQLAEAQAKDAPLEQQLGLLKGQFEPADFHPIRDKFTAEERRRLESMVNHSDALAPFDKTVAIKALRDKVFGEDGVRVPQDNELAKLGLVFGEDFVRTLAKSKPPGTLTGIIGSIRAVQSSDMASALFRQGGIFFWSENKIWRKAAADNFRYFKSQEAFQRHVADVIHHPLFKVADESGLAMTSVRGAEEPFAASQWVEHLSDFHFERPGLDRTGGAGLRMLGRYVTAADRAYSGFLTQLRFDIFTKYIENAEKAGVELTKDDVRRLATFINDFSGYGTWWRNKGKTLASHQFSEGSMVFYSPRFQVSAVKVLNPLNYVTKRSVYGEFARKAALKSFTHFALGNASILGLMSMVPGVEVGLDPGSADFAKLRYGKLRMDLLRGLPQWPRLLYRLSTLTYTSSTTGQKKRYGTGYGQKQPIDEVRQLIEGKAAPVVSMIAEQLRLQNVEGQPLTPWRRTTAAASHFASMWIMDTVDTWRTNPWLAPVSLVASNVGFGIQAYPMNTTNAMDRAKRIAVQWEAADQRPTRDLAAFQHKWSAYYKAVREDSDPKAVEKAKQEADLAAQAVVRWAGSFGLTGH